MGRIYFIGNEHGAIKIGFTGTLVDFRLQQLQAANSSELIILGFLTNCTEENEQNMLDRFSHLRIRGEWFAGLDDILNYVKSLPGADENKIQEWQQTTLSEKNRTKFQAAIIIAKAKLKAEQIKENARQEAKEIIRDAIGIVKDHAAIEVEKLISSNIGKFVFDCRCCQCGHARPTVRKRGDGLPWCDACWINHAIFDTGLLDDIVAKSVELAQDQPRADHAP